jgi:hypothetical protein
MTRIVLVMGRRGNISSQINRGTRLVGADRRLGMMALRSKDGLKIVNESVG